jgi:Domain of unknown function (DUF4397)
VAKDSHYVVIAYESGGALRTTVIAEDTAAPAAGTVSLRVFDAATDAGAIDVYVTDPATDITTLTSPTFSFGTLSSLQASGFLAIAPGTYRVRVTGSGNPVDLRLDMAAVTLTSQEVAALVLTPTTGGTLVNGAVLAQQGPYTAGRNTSARVRLAAAVSNGATVSAGAGAAVIANNVVAPSVGGYVIVPAAAPINVSVNGASVAAPAAKLAAGSDSTLLVYGSAAAPTASLIADDNHLPATSGNLKLRLLNGLTGALAAHARRRVRGHRQQRGAGDGVALRGRRVEHGTAHRCLLAGEPDADLQRTRAPRAGQRRLHALHARRRRDADPAPAPRSLSDVAGQRACRAIFRVPRDPSGKPW